MNQGVDAGVVIRMGVGHDDIFQVSGLKPSFQMLWIRPGMLPAHGVSSRISPSRYRSGGRSTEISHKVQIAPDLKGRAIHQIWPMHIFLCRRHIAETV